MYLERSAAIVAVGFISLFLVKPIHAGTLLRNGEQIALEATREYIAVRLNSHVNATDDALRRAVSPGSVMGRTPVLEQNRLVVIRPANDSTKTERLVAAFGKIRPVYKLSGIYVIPTYEVIVKVNKATQQSALSYLAKRGKVEPLNNRGIYVLTLPETENAVEVSNELNVRKLEFEFAEPNFISISSVLESQVHPSK